MGVICGFRQGGTVNTTYYIYCRCGWSSHVTNPNGPEAVAEGKRRLEVHIASVVKESTE